MTYREPGVYVTQAFKAPATIVSPTLMPVIIGSGAKKFAKQVSLRRSSEEYDILPSSVVNEIISIGDFNGSNDYSASSDYTLDNNILRWLNVQAAGTVSSATSGTVTLDAAASAVADAYVGSTLTIVSGTGAGQSSTISAYTAAKVATLDSAFAITPDTTSLYEVTKASTSKPSTGSSYYVKYVAGPESDQFEPKIFSTANEIKEFYGPDLKYDDGLPCPITIGGLIGLENGASAVCLLQVSMAGTTPTSEEYQTAIDNNLPFVASAYRIVAMDHSDAIQAIVADHVRKMSTPDERLERRAVLAKNPSASTFTAVLSDVGGYAASLSEKRFNVLYPNIATRQLSDGLYYELGASYLNAAYACGEAAQDPQIAMTRRVLYGFYALKGVKMTRVQKDLLAEKGVVVLQQEKDGANIVVRHGLTTDMTSVQTREGSITTVADYTSKILRPALERYVGREVITGETITRMEATINTILARLVQDKYITAGVIDQIFQDSENPDSIIVQVTITVPTPVNYVNVTLYIQ